MKGKGLASAAVLIVICLGNTGAAQPELHILRNGKSITAERPNELLSNVIAFAQSASVNLGQWREPAKSSNNWRKVLASDSLIHVVFNPARPLRLMAQTNQTRNSVLVEEILISLPEHRYPAIQAKSGTNYMALTKWQPDALAELVAEPALGLAKVPPYKDFNRFRRQSRPE